MSIVKRTGQILGWLGLNTTLYLLMALGFLTGYGWAWNLYVFLAWIGMLLYGCLLTAKVHAIKEGKPETLELYSKVTPPVPLWIDSIVDGLAVLALVAFGHWFYALLKITEIGLYQAFYKKEIPPRSSAEGTSVS